MERNWRNATRGAAPVSTLRKHASFFFSSRLIFPLSLSLSLLPLSPRASLARVKPSFLRRTIPLSAHDRMKPTQYTHKHTTTPKNNKNRPHRSLEKGLDWLLWVYRTVWPLVALAVVARLTSPPQASHPQHSREEEMEEEEEMEGYNAFGGEEELLAARAAARAAAAQAGGALSPSFALHAHAGGVPAGPFSGAAAAAEAAAQAHLSMLSPRAKAAVAHAAAVAGNGNGNGNNASSPLGSDRSRGSNGRQQQRTTMAMTTSKQHSNNASSFADVFSRAAQALGGVGNGNSGHNNDAASAGGSSNGGRGGGGKGNNSKSSAHSHNSALSPKLAAISTGALSNLSPRRGSLDEQQRAKGGDKGGGGARRNLNGGGGSGVIRASYS